MTSHFRQCMEQKSTPIDRQLNNMVYDEVSLNSGRLEPIVGGVIYFGRTFKILGSLWQKFSF